MERFQNKYRIQSHRKPQWDYSENGIYFITLVTQNRECHLGQIAETHGRASVELSDFGKIVNEEWLKSFEIRDELFLDEYIIMPNHLHAIVRLEKPETHGVHVETHGRASLPSHPKSSPSSSHPQSSLPQLSFIRKPKSISSFIGGFKSAINSKIDDYIDEHHLEIPKYNRDNHFFQPNYHDHIIRDERSYQNISKYILNNPAKWQDDQFNPFNQKTRQ